MGFPGGASDKEPACQCRRHKRRGFDSWVRKVLWRKAWQPTPVFLPGESHGQRSLVGGRLWGHTESDTTETTQQQQQQQQQPSPWGFPGGARGKEPACQCRRHKRHGFDPCVRKIPWRRKPTPVFLLGKFYGQRSLVGYSSWGSKELDMTERLNTAQDKIIIV